MKNPRLSRLVIPIAGYIFEKPSYYSEESASVMKSATLERRQPESDHSTKKAKLDHSEIYPENRSDLKMSIANDLIDRKSTHPIGRDQFVRTDSSDSIFTSATLTSLTENLGPDYEIRSSLEQNDGELDVLIDKVLYFSESSSCSITENDVSIDLGDIYDFAESEQLDLADILQQDHESTEREVEVQELKRILKSVQDSKVNELKSKDKKIELHMEIGAKFLAENALLRNQNTGLTMQLEQSKAQLSILRHKNQTIQAHNNINKQGLVSLDHSKMKSEFERAKREDEIRIEKLEFENHHLHRQLRKSSEEVNNLLQLKLALDNEITDLIHNQPHNNDDIDYKEKFLALQIESIGLKHDVESSRQEILSLNEIIGMLQRDLQAFNGVRPSFARN